jgi:hypothetical protein
MIGTRTRGVVVWSYGVIKTQKYSDEGEIVNPAREITRLNISLIFQLINLALHSNKPFHGLIHLIKRTLPLDGYSWGRVIFGHGLMLINLIIIPLCKLRLLICNCIMYSSLVWNTFGTFLQRYLNHIFHWIYDLEDLWRTISAISKYLDSDSITLIVLMEKSF